MLEIFFVRDINYSKFESTSSGTNQQQLKCVLHFAIAKKRIETHKKQVHMQVRV